jgi:peptidoglycan-N-acetylglucosamine deacetylase
MTRTSALPLSALAAAAMVNAAPTLALLKPVGVRLAPRLVGIGRPGHVAITFDDGPDPSSTPAILEALADLECRATFFVLGPMAGAAPRLTARIVEEGHEVGVHGHHHRSGLVRSPGALHRDLHQAVAQIEQACGRRPLWFRPPYGHLSVVGWHAAQTLGLNPVLWTAWGRDWRAAATPRSILADVGRGRLDGGTILLHDSDCTSAPGSWRNTLAALPGLVSSLRQQGLEPGPLGDHGLDR